MIAAPFFVDKINNEDAAGIYVVTCYGTFSRLDIETGLPCFILEMQDLVEANPPFISSPTAVPSGSGGNFRLYFGGSVGHLAQKPVLFCFD